MPFPSGFVVMNGWKGSDAIDGGSPLPLSEMLILQLCADMVAMTVMVGLCFCATASSEFFRILVSACVKRASSM